jgi:hypothetical protein
VARGLVVKMELCPETEELLVQNVGVFGFMKTRRFKIEDLEIYDKSKLGVVFLRFARAMVDFNMIFRHKKTGEILFFDQEGLWYEEGINHELMV